MIRPVYVALVLLFAVVLGSCAVTKAAAGPAAAVPDENGFYKVEAKGFKLLYQVIGDQLMCVLESPSNGWAAVGLAPSSMMKDANFIIGYVSEGYAYISDEFGTGRTEHEPDENLGGSNDIILNSFDESDGFTRLTFFIPLDSGDRFDRRLELGKSYKVIFGAGYDDDFGSYHKAVASATITLRN